MSDGVRAITMPKWGLAMTEGQITSWLVDEGAHVAPGDEIAEIETTKITNVFESPAAGRLRRRVVGQGDIVPVGGLLGVLAEESVPEAEIDDFIRRFEERFEAEGDETAAEPPEPAFAFADGRRARYLEMGSGEGAPVLLLHGFGADLNNWMFNQPALAESHPVLALDLPGHGGSEKEVGAGDVATLAAAVIDFADARGIERAHLIGHSLGGAIALDMALRHPDRAASLTLVCPAAMGPSINADFLAGFIGARRRKDLKPVLELLVDDPSLISREMVDEVLKFKRLDGAEAALEKIAATAFADGGQTLVLADRLGELSMPAQIIWGRTDRIIPVAQAAAAPARIPCHVLDGAGHMPHLEKPREVNRLIGDFLLELPAPQAPGKL